MANIQGGFFYVRLGIIRPLIACLNKHIYTWYACKFRGNFYNYQEYIEYCKYIFSWHSQHLTDCWAGWLLMSSAVQPRCSREVARALAEWPSFGRWMRQMPSQVCKHRDGNAGATGANSPGTARTPFHPPRARASRPQSSEERWLCLCSLRHSVTADSLFLKFSGCIVAQYFKEQDVTVDTGL